MQRHIDLNINELCTVNLYPYEEVLKVMAALEEAEKQDDLAALKWCARKTLWLFNVAEVSTGALSSDQVERLFNVAYFESDDPPDSISKYFA